MLGFKRKNLIALALAAIVAVSGFGVYNAQAAGKIDENKTCYVSVKVNKDENSSNPFYDYSGYVTVRFYKVADISLTGQYENVVSGVDLSSLSGSKVTTEDTQKVAEAAYKAFKLDAEKEADKASATASVSFDLSNMSEATSVIDRGLYLFVPQPTYDNIYDYTFKYSLVSIPSSDYIETATKVDENGNIVADDSVSDKWNYDVDIILKPEATPRYGKLQITKNLTTFDTSLGTASFVYKVIAKRGESVVFSNVYMIDMDEAGTNSITIEGIPAGSVASVEEVYTGASYTAQTNKVEDIKIVADENIAVAEFVNDYDKRLEVGGIAVENHFTKSNDENVSEGYVWNGSNLTQKTTNVEGGAE